MVQDQDYKEDASKFPNQILTIIDGLPKMCGVWRCDVVMKDDTFSIDQF